MTLSGASATERQQKVCASRLAEGLAAHGRGQLADAARSYLSVLAIDSGNVDALNLLGLAQVQAGHARGAVALLSRAVALDPAFPEALNHLALARMRSGALGEGLRVAIRALAASPGLVEAHANCGSALSDLGRHVEAIGCYDRALALKPDYADAHANRGNALQLLGRLDEARPAYARALRPGLAEAHSNLASLDQAEGELSGAIVGFRRALALRPAPWVHSNLLFCLAYDGRIGDEAFFAEFRRWEAAYAAPVHATAPAPAPTDADSGRRLRIGWISADLRDHPVARNVIGLVEHRDRAEGDCILYSSTRTPDAMTDRFRAAADGWREVLGVADADVAGQMRADRLDLLIVLAGHTGHNRIGVAAHRPAAIQVSFHDLATSGLEAVDAWITDGVLHPPDTTERFTERLVRLPCFYLHEPPAEAPAPAPLPALAAGHVTFGSCNNTSKHTPEVLALWAAVLKSVPGSRLLLKYLNRYASARLRQRVRDAFAAEGVDPGRLVFVTGQMPRRDQLAVLNRVDIALDPFPFNGSTTSFEALWMGVPVVSLAGTRFLGRVGASVLHQVGLDALVAADPVAYVARAAALAADLLALAELRAGLRARVAGSLLCDAPAHGRAFDAALRGLWRDWCRSR